MEKFDEGYVRGKLVLLKEASRAHDADAITDVVMDLTQRGYGWVAEEILEALLVERVYHLLTKKEYQQAVQLIETLIKKEEK